MLDRKRVPKIKLEATSGTKIATDQAVRAYDLTGPESEAEYLKRAGAGLYAGNAETGVHGAEVGRCSFRTPLIGTGSSGMGLGCLILLQAAWLKKTSEVYQVTSDVANWKTLTLDAWLDGQKKTLFGAMGNIVLNWEGNSPDGAMLAVDLQGLYSAVTDEAMPAWVPETITPMKMISFEINNVDAKIHSFSLDMQNVVVPDSDPNAAAVLRSNVMPGTEIAHYIIPNNAPQITIDPLDVLVATYDFDGLRRVGTEHEVEAIFSDGTDTITILMPKVQIVECKRGERNEQSTIQYVGQCNHSAGDDAVSITVT